MLAIASAIPYLPIFGRQGSGRATPQAAPKRTDTSFDTPGSCIVTP